MIVSEIYFHVVVARGVFSYKYLYFSIPGYVEFKELRRMHEYRHLDIPLRYSSRLLPLTYCLWEIPLLQFFLIVRAASRQIVQIEVENETWFKCSLICSEANFWGRQVWKPLNWQHQYFFCRIYFFFRES